MERRGGAARVWVLAAVSVLGLSACRDMGLRDRNLPLTEARHRAIPYAVYQPVPENAPVAAAGYNWLPALTSEQIPEHMLEPVGAAEGTQLYALRGSRAPHSRLYAPLADGSWQPHLRLD